MRRGRQSPRAPSHRETALAARLSLRQCQQTGRDACREDGARLGRDACRPARTIHPLRPLRAFLRSGRRRGETTPRASPAPAGQSAHVVPGSGRLCTRVLQDRRDSPAGLQGRRGARAQSAPPPAAGREEARPRPALHFRRGSPRTRRTTHRASGFRPGRRGLRRKRRCDQGALALPGPVPANPAKAGEQQPMSARAAGARSLLSLLARTATAGQW